MVQFQQAYNRFTILDKNIDKMHKIGKTNITKEAKLIRFRGLERDKE